MSARCLSVKGSSISVRRLRSRVSSLMYSSCRGLVVALASCVTRIVFPVIFKYFDSSSLTAYQELQCSSSNNNLEPVRHAHTKAIDLDVL